MPAGRSRVSRFHPGYGIQFNQFLVRGEEPFLMHGAHRIRFLSTPHFPHGWDAGLFFEEMDRTLLCSDPFFHPGDPEPLTETDVVERAAGPVRASVAGPMAHDMPFTPHTRATLDRLAALEPRTLVIMHGSAWRGDGARAIRDLASVIAETLS